MKWYKKIKSNFKHIKKEKIEKFYFWLVFKLPKKFIYYCVIRSWAECSSSADHCRKRVDEIKVTHVLDHLWDRPRNYWPNCFGIKYFEEDYKDE